MGKAKKKYKGIKYIAKALADYFPKKYKDNKKLAKEKAREVLATLTAEKKTVKLDNIFPLIRKKRKVQAKKTIAPTIPDYLTEERYYFELVDFPDYIALTTNEVFFISTISPAGLPAIQGGSNVSYEEYFSDFVNYINSMKSLTEANSTHYETDWLVTCTEPIENPATKRYESKIISIDKGRNEIDYGFDPKKPEQKPDDLILSNKQKQTVEVPSEIKKEEKPASKEIAQPDIKRIEAETKRDEAIAKKTLAEAEKLRQENISRALKLAEQGWSKLEIKEILSKL